jgi:hypothetical protein
LSMGEDIQINQVRYECIRSGSGNATLAISSA